VRTIALFTILIISTFAIITAMTRPDIINKKYSEIRAPIDQYLAEKSDKIWNDAKQTERAMWMLKLRLPHDCSLPKTAIREIECNNLMQMHAQIFEQNWSNKVRNGWKPDGVSN
jgi:hypothetical protein